MAFIPKKIIALKEEDNPIVTSFAQSHIEHHGHTGSNFQAEHPLQGSEIAKFVIAPITNHNKEPTPKYNGVEIETLEKSGIYTPNIIKVAAINKAQIKTPLIQLDSIPIKNLLLHMQATHLHTNVYQLHNCTIAIKEETNKWYHTELRKGNTNAISLVKHLTAQKEKMSLEEERENDRELTVFSVKFLRQNEIYITKIEQQRINTQHSTAPTVQTDNIKKLQYIELIKKLDNIPLGLVMEYLGASQNEDGQRGKWKIHSTGHNIHVTGQQWKNWNSNRKGSIGAISLLAHHIGITNNISETDEASRRYLRHEAIQQLKKAFANDLESIELTDHTASHIYKQPFCIPHVIPEKFSAVQDYLHTKRKIPLWIINKQFNSGFLYAGFPSDWEYDPALKSPSKLANTKVWATFLSINGNAAELRAIERTDEYAKMLAKGSDKDLGGFLIKAEPTHKENIVVTCEAAIDAMSYHALYPGRITLSCMGVNFNLATKAAVDALDNDYKFKMGFDNDRAGNEATVSFVERMIEELGEESFFSQWRLGNIQLFELGMHCFEECIKSNKVFYFDVLNNAIGTQVFKLFYEQLNQQYGKNTLSKLHKDNKVKYINLLPNFYDMIDPKLEAQKTYDLLNSGKPYYLLYKNPTNETPVITEKRLRFEHEFQKISIHKIDEWQKNGSVITKNQTIGKDWNEFLAYSLQKIDFEKTIQEQEAKFKKHHTLQGNKKNKPA